MPSLPNGRAGELRPTGRLGFNGETQREAVPETGQKPGCLPPGPRLPVPPEISIEDETLIENPRVVENLEPIEFVRFDGRKNAGIPKDSLLVFTIHDGGQVPRHLWGDRSEEVLNLEEVRYAYMRERDWGANRVAEHLARSLGLAGYLRVNLARVILDFGRFPGTSALGEEYLRRHSMFPPVEHLLSEDAKHEVLARYYDGISQGLTQHFVDKKLTIGVHTYDRFNRSGTERPRLSLISRSLEYQLHANLPPYIFDPLFPAVLAEATCDRSLIYRLGLDLEMAGHPTATDFPYLMPEGSVEIRAQVWYFFRHLRKAFTEAHPETRDKAEYLRIWQMLQDVTRRSPDCERLRAFLHRYRDAPPNLENVFARARTAYGEIKEFLQREHHKLVEGYSFSTTRASCLGIEVRKDQMSVLNERNEVLGPRELAGQRAEAIAEVIGTSIKAHFARSSKVQLWQDEEAGTLVPAGVSSYLAAT
jgi:hypothetical protein